MPAPPQRQESDEKLEVKIGRNRQQLKDDGLVPEMIQISHACGQIHKPDGRLDQLIERQPEVLDMTPLREIKSQQEERQHHDKDGVDQPGKAFKEVMRGPQLQ